MHYADAVQTLKVQVYNRSQTVWCLLCNDEYFVFYGYIYPQPLSHFIQKFGNKVVFGNKPDIQSTSCKGSLNILLLYFAYLWDRWAELFKVSKGLSQEDFICLLSLLDVII